MRATTSLYVSAIITAALATTSHALDLKDKIDPLAQPLIGDGQVVGMVVGIVKDGQTQVLVYGETKKGSKQAPTADTVYEIGSVTKVFTGVLLADAVRQGRCGFDDPISKHLPDAQKVPQKDDTPITLRHLATHTSGLPRMPDNFKPADPKQPYADYGRKQLHAFLERHELRRAPGKHEYSNYGMGLLGELLADRWESDYEAALQKRILSPLDLKDTHVKLNDSMRERLAPGYDAALNEESAWEFEAMAGAGGIRSTARDMLKFIQANLAEDEKPITIALRDAHKKQPLPTGGQKMALGWHIARDGITRWHNGMTGGYHSWLAVVPDHGIGVVVLSNTATAKVTGLGDQITRVAFGIDVKPPQQRKQVEVAVEVLKTYVGTYRLSPKFELVVTLEGDQLMVQATGQQKFPIYAESKTKFFYKVVDAQVTFTPDDDGKVNNLTLHQNGLNLPGKRHE